MIAGVVVAKGDLIAQFIDVAALDREMADQLCPRRFDRLQNPLGELLLAKSLGQLLGDLIPELLGNLRVNSLISEDRELLILGSDEQEHSIAQLGPSHPQSLESPP